MLADRDICTREDAEYVFGLEIECNLQLPEHNVVIQFCFGLGNRTILSAAFLDDQTVQKGREHDIAAFLKFGVVILFQPGADLVQRHLLLGFGKYGNHGCIIEIEDVTDSAQDIVALHGFLALGTSPLPDVRAAFSDFGCGFDDDFLLVATAAGTGSCSGPNTGE